MNQFIFSTTTTTTTTTSSPSITPSQSSSSSSSSSNSNHHQNNQRHSRKSSVSISPPFTPIINNNRSLSNSNNKSSSNHQIISNSSSSSVSSTASSSSSSSSSTITSHDSSNSTTNSSPIRPSNCLRRKSSLDSIPSHLRSLKLNSTLHQNPNQKLLSPNPHSNRRARSSSASSTPRPLLSLLDQPSIQSKSILTSTPDSNPPLSPSTKKSAPPPLDLTTTHPSRSQNNSLTSPALSSVTLDPSSQPPPQSSPWPYLITSSTAQPPHPDSTFEEEERKAAEWYGSSSPAWPESTFVNSSLDDVYDPMLIMTGQDENGLTTMEKIFLFAKSENAYHRVIVSQRLPELLEDVDISEAVEYVLPLLTGLARDDEPIREAFGPSLCNIMWYFFSKCPLLEFEAQAGTVNHTTPVPSTSLSPPPQKRPTLYLNTFTSLLITLLTDPNEAIGVLARYGLLIFLTRLQGNHNHQADLPAWIDVGVGSSDAFLPVNTTEDVGYEHYEFGPAERLAIIQEVINGVTLGLCRTGSDHVTNSNTPSLPVTNLDDAKNWDNPSLADNSPNLRVANMNDDEDQSSDSSSNLVIPFSPELNRCSMNDYQSPTSPNGLSTQQDYFTSSEDLSPIDSSQQAIRRQIGLGLIGSMIETGCIPAKLMWTRLVPQVLRAAKHSYERSLLVRQQAAVTLTTIFHTIPTATPTDRERDLESNTTDLVESFVSLSSDPEVAVRKQACLGLPGLARLRNGRKVIESLVERFGSDDSREVRLVASQVLGEVIYGFGFGRVVTTVPDRLVEWYADGFPKDLEEEELQSIRQQQQWNGFGSMMRPGFGSCNNLAGPANGPTTSSSLSSSVTFSSLFNSPTTATSIEEAERAMSRAFSFPAVILTLGSTRWTSLRPLYLKLSTDTRFPIQVRRSLACSIHEVIKIVMSEPDSSDNTVEDDCVEVLQNFLFEGRDLTILEAVLEHLEISLGYLSQSNVMKILQRMKEILSPDLQRITMANNWRIRERLGRLLPKLWEKYEGLDHDDDQHQQELVTTFEELLINGLCDGAAAVREACLEFVPTLYRTTRHDGSEIRSRLLATLLSLSQHSNYRIRMTYPTAMISILKITKPPLDISRISESLERISEDKVGGVRICLARLICELNQIYLTNETNWSTELIKVIEKLKIDEEIVVRNLLEEVKIPKMSHSSNSNPEEEDLEGSGVEVFGSRLSEDEDSTEDLSIGTEGNQEVEDSLILNGFTPPESNGFSDEGDHQMNWVFRNHHQSSNSHNLPNPTTSTTTTSVVGNDNTNSSNTNGSSNNSNSQGLWMRDTDGGFVEVGGQY